MIYNKNYWLKKEERAEYARKHTKEMEQKYEREIEDCFRNSKIYGPDFIIEKNKLQNKHMMSILLDDLDSVSAVMDYTKDKRTAVLNFASYKNPGGNFINGSSAQEESLCKESFLYNVLKKYENDFYGWNRTRINRSLYLDRAIYSPDVIFEKKGKSVKCDVITCAAPNKTAAQKYNFVSDDENNKALKKRIRFILDIAEDQKVKVLILGAFGCGVFGQDPIEVASIFKEELADRHFDTVLFAIPDQNSKNYKAFNKIY